MGFFKRKEMKIIDVNVRHTVPNEGLMLGQRRRRWVDIKPTIGQRLVFLSK